MLCKLLSNQTSVMRAAVFQRRSLKTCHAESTTTTCGQSHNLLADFLGQTGGQGARLLDTRHEQIPTAAAAIKTMVLVQQDLNNPTQQAPGVAVLLLAGHKVDLRAAAQHMQLPRGSLRLATADEAEAITGYELGCIPPLGHVQTLRTLVDVHIVQLPPQQLVCAGGGADKLQLLLPVQQLMAACAGEQGSFSTTKQASSQQELQWQQGGSSETDALPQQQQQQQQQQEQQQRQQPAGPASFVHLPQPWVEGAQEVELVGVLAQRRRIAKLLLFATLVPESVPSLPSDGTAAYVRRLWRHPTTGMPCEVQLICGKTIERQLGREGAAALFDRLKVGSVVALKGRVQQHPQPPAAATSTGSNGSNGSTEHHQHVLDLVVQEIRVLHKNRDTLARAIAAARRRGHTDVSSAADLEQLPPDSNLAGTAATQADPQAVAAGTAKAAMLTWKRETVQATAAPPAVAAGAVAQGSAGAVSMRDKRSQDSRQQAASNQPDQEQQQYYAFALGLQDITFVQDLQGVLSMQQAVLGQLPAQHSTSMSSRSSSVSDISSSRAGSSSSNASGSSSGSAGEAVMPVVGLDCEWQPYERGAQKSPVALLQLATRQQVFVVDMLALCTQQQQAPKPENSNPSSSQEDGSNASPGCSSSSNVSTPSECALADFLQQLFTHAGIKVVGFGLVGDLQRLANSYPQLLRCHPAATASECDNGSTSPGLQAASPSNVADGASTVVVTPHSPSITTPNAADAVNAQQERWVVQQAVELQQLCVKADPGSWQKGLSEVVNRSLGSPLDKAQQASNWAARPLSAEQLLYAATDAHVLTVLYDELLARVAADVAP